jgi:hypothetical protein
MEETAVHGENHRPDASHWQTLSHNVVSPRHERIRTHISGDRHWDVCKLGVKIVILFINTPLKQKYWWGRNNLRQMTCDRNNVLHHWQLSFIERNYSLRFEQCIIFESGSLFIFFLEETVNQIVFLINNCSYMLLFFVCLLFVLFCFLLMIYNYLCNQCLSPLMLWVRMRSWRGDTTLCDKVCQWLVVHL